MQIPSNMLITRIKPGVYMSAWMIIWAVVSGMATNNLCLFPLIISSLHRACTELWRHRCLSILFGYRRGTCEYKFLDLQTCLTGDAVLPRCNVYAIYLLYSQGYVAASRNSRSHNTNRATEVAARIAMLYCAQILATGFSGLIAAGIFAGLDNVRGLAGWRW